MRINALVAKAQKTPEEGWIMQDGTPWPGNNPRDHPGMIQVHCILWLKLLNIGVLKWVIAFNILLTPIYVFVIFLKGSWQN